MSTEQLGGAPAPGIRRTDLILFAFAVGVASGLLEGAGHVALPRLFFVADNSWFQAIWISAILNGIVAGVVGAVASLVVSRWPARKMVAVAVFVIFLSGVVPILALMLKEWIYPPAILLVTLGICVTLTRLVLGRTAAAFRIARRALPWLLATAACAFAATEGGGRFLEWRRTASLPPARDDAPNVVLIVIDTARSDHFGTYGYRRQTTPFLDRLAGEGVIFDHAFAASSYTLPSHASLVTGLYPREHNVEWRTSLRAASRNAKTLPQALSGGGYRTAAFSANTFYFSREHGFGRGFLHFEDFYHSISDMFWRSAYGGIARRYLKARLGVEDLPGRKLAEDVREDTLRWIARDTGRPYFAMLNFLDAHDPYLPPMPYRSKFSGRADSGGLLNANLHVPKTISPEALQDEIDAYDGGLAYIDDQIRLLLDSLRAQPTRRDLVVIVTSDHGEEFKEHGGFFHGSNLYREVLQVPLFVWAPGRVPAGARIRPNVSNASIPATVAYLAGVDAPEFRTPSLHTLWSSTPPNDWPAPLAELLGRPWAPKDEIVSRGTLRSVLELQWHYIEQETQAPQFYDWMADPREATNLVDRPEVQTVLPQVRGRLK